jgi:hypothetical protein
MARLTSPALSESLELTAVSRFLGPVPEYTVQTDRTAIGSIHIPPTSTTLRGQNGRYISRKTKRNYVPSERCLKLECNQEHMLTVLQVDQKGQTLNKSS